MNNGSNGGNGGGGGRNNSGGGGQYYNDNTKPRNARRSLDSALPVGGAGLPLTGSKNNNKKRNQSAKMGKSNSASSK